MLISLVRDLTSGLHLFSQGIRTAFLVMDVPLQSAGKSPFQSELFNTKIRHKPSSQKNPSLNERKMTGVHRQLSTTWNDFVKFYRDPTQPRTIILKTEMKTKYLYFFMKEKAACSTGGPTLCHCDTSTDSHSFCQCPMEPTRMGHHTQYSPPNTVWSR